MARNPGVRQVSTSEALFEACRAGDVEVVFCDFAALPDGLTGPRVSKRLRDRGFLGRIVLLSETVAPTQVQWARCNGADDVIARDIAAIERMLPSGGQAGVDIDLSERARPRAVLAPTQVGEVPEAIQLVSKALNEVALGPAASVVVTQAWRQYKARVGVAPTVVQLAQLCVGHVEPAAEVRRRYWSLIKESGE